MTRPIYMDYHATTPLDPRVLDTMLPYFTTDFGNAASVDHEYGAVAAKVVEQSRASIAAAIGASQSEIVFTSGATEADNLAILGVAEAYADKGKHIITAATEHPAVLDTCAYLEAKGWDVTYLNPDVNGILDAEDIRKAITRSTVLVSIMAANNEIGTLASLATIGNLTREHEVLFHTDATQAVGRVPIDVVSMNIDLLSLSGHKIYGPKGIGALYVRRSSPRVRLRPQIHGGGHERGMRSGTLNVPAIVGMAKALELATTELERESRRLRDLRDDLLGRLCEAIPDIEVNGHPTDRLPNNLNIYIPGINSRSLTVAVKGELAISTGSACATFIEKPSHVLLAIGHNPSRAASSIRIGLGRFNSSPDIEHAASTLASAVRKLSEIR